MATQHSCLPSLLGDGDKEIVIVYGEEKSILCWAERAAKAEQKFSCTGTTSPTNQPRKDPLHLYPLSPHSPKFQQSAGGPPLSSLSDVANVIIVTFLSFLLLMLLIKL